jgi:hypothetical protein
MKYLCLVYIEEKILNSFPSNALFAISEEAMSYCDKLQKAGQLAACVKFHSSSSLSSLFIKHPVRITALL